MKIINIINDKLLLLIIMNIIIFYSPIEKHLTDHFLFKGRMAFSQIVEGVLGLLECFIPRYEGQD